MEVAIGIDTHKGSLAAAAVDPLGRVLDVREFANDPKGHRSLVQWVKLQEHPPQDRDRGIAELRGGRGKDAA